MIFSGQRTRKGTALALAALMGGSLLLSGCGYTLVSTDDLIQLNTSVLSAQEEETEEEPQEQTLPEQQLENQLLSVLNLGADETYVTASAALDTVGSFFLDIVLEEMQNKAGITAVEVALQSSIEQLKTTCTFLFIYDGTLSAAQAGQKALSDITEKLDTDYSAVKDISVSYGTKDGCSAWVILAQYES